MVFVGKLRRDTEWSPVSSPETTEVSGAKFSAFCSRESMMAMTFAGSSLAGSLIERSFLGFAFKHRSRADASDVQFSQAVFLGSFVINVSNPFGIRLSSFSTPPL